MKKIAGFFKAVLLLILLFLIGFLSFNLFMKILVDHKHEEKTPSVVGMSFETARQVCRNNNLYLEEVKRLNNDDLPQGQIISQNPNPGIMTKRFRTVKVVVSDGPEMVVIPFLANLTVIQAKMKLQNAGLMLGEKNYRYSDEVQKDLVMLSNPLAGQPTPRGSKIDVIVSLGKIQGSDNKYDKYKDLLDE
ncbi:MAG: PASTA domain-containing protein [Candidatus Cloacimonetes bacterium]|nr:PASTA domain-containing protein [Candidatus Cloacimonadota bacterium]